MSYTCVLGYSLLLGISLLTHPKVVNHPVSGVILPCRPASGFEGSGVSSPVEVKRLRRG